MHVDDALLPMNAGFVGARSWLILFHWFFVRDGLKMIKTANRLDFLRLVTPLKLGHTAFVVLQLLYTSSTEK